MSDLPDIPVGKPPEYLSWDLKKLQNEYFSLRLKYTALSINNSEDKTRLEKVNTFIESLKELLEASNE